MWGGAPRFPRRPPQRAKAPLPRFFLLIIFYQAFASGDDFTLRLIIREVESGLVRLLCLLKAKEKAPNDF